MSELKPWRDPVVAEIHAVREALATQFHDDLHAYTKAAEARCRALGLVTFSGSDTKKTTPTSSANADTR